MYERKNNRLKEYDYSTGGYYFITTCVDKFRICLGEEKKGKILLSKYGEIVSESCNRLQIMYSYVSCDEFIVMSNHFHGINK